MATARQTAINSNPIVTPRRILHPRKSAAASEIRSSAQTTAKKPKNHLLYKNFRIRVSGVDTTQAHETADARWISGAETAHPTRFNNIQAGICPPSTLLETRSVTRLDRL